jgi:GNAT superfamily N-acetyltransferase
LAPQAVPGLEVVRVEDDRGLEAMIAVRTVADPDLPPPRIENLRHHLASMNDLVYLAAWFNGEPVGCGFVHPWPPEHAEAHFVVVPGARRRGVGSALFGEVSEWARTAGKQELEGEVREDDAESRAYFERRGYRVVGGEQAVALDLAAIDAPEPSPPAGVRIASRAELPDMLEQLYEIGLEAAEDIPGTAAPPTFEQWRSTDIDRPTRRPELFFVALADGTPVGYAILDDFGRDAHHGLTATRRSWRRRGIATALKQTQIAAAKRAGYRRLVTESEERNTPMRNLNAKLGYRPEPSLSTVVLRGPLRERRPTAKPSRSGRSSSASRRSSHAR